MNDARLAWLTHARTQASEAAHHLESAIHATPTSAIRDDLTNANIYIQRAIEHLTLAIRANTVPAPAVGADRRGD